jgi:hypothetical protein
MRSQSTGLHDSTELAEVPWQADFRPCLGLNFMEAEPLVLSLRTPNPALSIHLSASVVRRRRLLKRRGHKASTVHRRGANLS